MDRPEAGCGVVFIASGAFHAAAAAQAAKSVRETNPGLPIDLYTDVEESSGLFDKVIRIDAGHLRSKVDWLAASRFERSLYLDSDIRVVAGLAPMFAILDRFEIALTHSHSRLGPRQNMFWRTPIPEGFPQLNGGVILYRGTPPVRAFLESWKRAYHEAGFKWDQITLRELLWLSDLRLYVLPPEYNIRYKKYLEVWDAEEAEPKILHFAEFYDATAAIPGVARRTDKNIPARLKRAFNTLRARLRI